MRYFEIMINNNKDDTNYKPAKIIIDKLINYYNPLLNYNKIIINNYIFIILLFNLII